MNLIKQTDYAALHNVSRKTVTKWKSRGWLVFQGNLVDVDASNELLQRYRRGRVETVTQRTKGNAKGNAHGNGQGNQDATEGNGFGPRQISAFDEARIKKETYLGKLHELEYEKKAGTVIELDTARRVFFDVFRGQRDAWLNWPIQVGPLVAARLGLEADLVTEVLTEFVHEQITRLSEPEPNPDFTNG